jgi:hypothetical protein
VVQSANEGESVWGAHDTVAGNTDGVQHYHAVDINNQCYHVVGEEFQVAQVSPETY